MVSGLTSKIFNPMDASKTLEYNSDRGMYLAVNYTPWENFPKDNWYYKEEKKNYQIMLYYTMMSKSEGN